MRVNMKYNGENGTRQQLLLKLVFGHQAFLSAFSQVVIIVLRFLMLHNETDF